MPLGPASKKPPLPSPSTASQSRDRLYILYPSEGRGQEVQEGTCPARQAVWEDFITAAWCAEGEELALTGRGSGSRNSSDTGIKLKGKNKLVRSSGSGMKNLSAACE